MLDFNFLLLLQLFQCCYNFCVNVIADGSATATAAAEISQEGTLPHGVGEGVNEAAHPKILQVVLVSPQVTYLLTRHL